MKGHHIVEVSASSTPKEVIGAIVCGPPKAPNSNPIKWFQLAFAFILVFGVIIYFREEIYTFSKDVQRHPILAAVEDQQLHKYIGSNWVFGSGKGVERSTENLLEDSSSSAAFTGVNATSA